jgi:hypothetical protein
MSNPLWFKRFGGTVGMSSIGMFGPGGGWGIPIAPPTLMITVGGMTTKPIGRTQARPPRVAKLKTVAGGRRSSAAKDPATPGA